MSEELMTVGDLSKRTGMSAKLVRRLTDMGLIYSPGRSQAGYRLYDEAAIWCVEVITRLRQLGLTISQISQLGDAYLSQPDSEVAELFQKLLDDARHRVGTRIERLAEVKERQEHVLQGGGSAAGFTLPSDPTRA